MYLAFTFVAVNRAFLFLQCLLAGKRAQRYVP